MGHHVTTVKEDVKIARDGFLILLAITLGEIFVALIGNGHIIEGHTWWKIIMIPLMTILSLIKAAYIVGIFMHLGSETRPMLLSIVLPMMLFIWAITAFLWEGDSWRDYQNYIDDKDSETVKPSDKKDDMGQGSIIKESDELSKEISFR